MIKAIALDDEPLALEVIKTFCQDSEHVRLMQVFTEQDKAIKYINKFEVDLLFLDIQMPKLNGIDLYKSLKQKTKVIFTTAYSHYAVEGFNVSATDYLLKPYSKLRFLESLQKVKKEIDLETKSSGIISHLTIRADLKLQHIPLESIVFIEALDDYIQVHLEDETKIIARYTMKSILKKLPQSSFKRVHRSFIISLNKIKSITKDTIVIQDFVIPISATYKDELLKSFNI